MKNDRDRRFDAALENELDPMPRELAERILRATPSERLDAAARASAAGSYPARSKRTSRFLIAVAVACYALGTIITIAIERGSGTAAATTLQDPPREVRPESSEALIALLSDLESIDVHATVGPRINNADPPWALTGETVAEPLDAEGMKFFADMLRRGANHNVKVTHATSARVVLRLGAPHRYVVATVGYHSPQSLRVGEAGTFALSERVAKLVTAAAAKSGHRTLMRRGIVMNGGELKALPVTQTALTCFGITPEELATRQLPALTHLDLAGMGPAVTDDVFDWLLALPKLESLVVRPTQLNPGRIEQLAKRARLRSLVVDGNGSPQIETATSCAQCHVAAKADPIHTARQLSALAQFDTLKHFGLRSVIVRPEVAKAIAEMAMLETLDLSGASLAEFPARVLTAVPVLQEIILQHAHGITDKQVDALASIGHLRRLDLRGTRGFDEGRIRQLVKALPTCEILLPGHSK